MTDFNDFKSIFSDEIAKFTNFQNIIKEDFNNLFDIGHLISTIRNNIVAGYKNKINSTLQKLNNKLAVIGPHFL